MAAKDKSYSFDFSGTYTDIQEHARIEYDLDDKRHVAATFTSVPERTKIVQTFDPEAENSREMQQSGWQAILDNFTKYVESTV